MASVQGSGPESVVLGGEVLRDARQSPGDVGRGADSGVGKDVWKWVDVFMAGEPLSEREGLSPGERDRERSGMIAVDQGDQGEGLREVPNLETPSTNRGVATYEHLTSTIATDAPKPSHCFKFDWNSATIHNNKYNDRLLGEWLGGVVQERTKQTPNGEAVVLTSDADPGCQCIRLEHWSQWIFSGESAHLCRPRWWRRMAEVCHDLGPRCRTSNGYNSGGVKFTRVDIAMDQYDSSVLPLRFPMDVRREVFESGRVNPWTVDPSSRRLVTSGLGDLKRLGGHVAGQAPPPGSFDLGDVTDETLYIGARASETFLRAYDMRGPLRWEWELKGGRAMVSMWQAVEAIAGGRGIGDVAREMFIGLGVEKLPGLPWGGLGSGLAVDPVPPTAWDLVAALDAMVRAYGPLYVSICDSGNAPAFLGECRRRLFNAHRATQWRQQRSLMALRSAGVDLWGEVAYRRLGGAELSAEVERVVDAA